MRKQLMSIMMLGAILLGGCGQEKSMKEPISEISQDAPVQILHQVEDVEEEETIKKKQESEPLIEKVDVEPSLEKQLATYIDHMTIEQKIGQLFMIAIRKDQVGEPITTLTEEVKKQIEEYQVGGIILFKENIETTEQTKALIEGLQGCSEIPLWIGVDEEGGLVSRVGANSSINSVSFKEAFKIGKTKNREVAYEEAKRMGTLLHSLGFNMDFAPVADIYNEPTNTVIGTRSFGVNADEVTPMVISFAKGLQETGVQPVVKHFPGHGNTVEDSHDGLAYVNKSLKELEAEELIPFRHAVEENIGVVMKGHLMVPTVDEQYPASLSKKWATYLENNWLVNDTLFITDAMDMGAITQYYSVEEATMLCIEAGNDICLMPADLEVAYNTLLNAYKEGKLTQERINRSVTKVLSKKLEHNLLVLE